MAVGKAALKEMFRSYIMTIQMYEYIDVKKRAAELQLNIPTELALLPRNFDVAESKEELLHEGSVPTIRILWQQSGVTETKLEKPGERFPYAQEKALEWLGPIIFISAFLLSENPHAISIALNMISSYLKDWFKGVPGSKKVKLDIVVEQTKVKKYKRIHYEGDAHGLNELARIVREVSNHE